MQDAEEHRTRSAGLSEHASEDEELDEELWLNTGSDGLVKGHCKNCMCQAWQHQKNCIAWSNVPAQSHDPVCARCGCDARAHVTHPRWKHA
eukprot:1630351-Amphidinium_carterae.1